MANLDDTAKNETPLTYTSEKSNIHAVKDQTQETADIPRGYWRSSIFLGSLAAIGMGLLSAIGGFGLLAPILGIVNQDIGPSKNLSWLSIVYTMAIAVGLTVVGRFTDIFGRRHTFIGGAVLGVVGSIVSSRANSIETLIGGMLLIGLAASTQVSYFYVTAELVPRKYRFIGVAGTYGLAAPATSISPVIAYACVAHTSAGWRTVFYILIGCNSVALLCWVLFYRPPTFEMKHRGQQKIEYAKKFDYLGLLLFVGGLVVFLIGIEWGGNLYSWSSARVICTIVVGGPALIVFVVWELYARLAEPLVPITLLADTGWTAAVVISGLAASVYYGFSVVWPNMVSIMFTTGDLVKDGALASILGIAWVCGSLTAGTTTTVLKHVKLQLIVTFLLGGIFLGSMATSNPDSRTRSCILLAFANFCFGWAEGQSLVSTTLALPNQQEMGTGCGFGGSVRFAISTIASVVYSTVLSHRLAVTIPDHVTPAVLKAGLPQSSVAEFLTNLVSGLPLKNVPGIDTSIILAGANAYEYACSDAYRTIFFVAIAFCGVGVIAAFSLPNLDALMTNDVETSLHHRNGDQESKVHERAVVVRTP
ncbi:hypothetical protein LTR10_024207 [Elasticomyces elasticus]|uniref:Major facilitator superfamily (MFS) profile domain-containing protein n=1 Tax=Exophiala sideris TaxID=1016849 RepID=A0ABR0IVC7_9EURO|nr:hypothetical protein LTR10_024207 [Elasticomyces elasticus]KAK5021096.1 hypothetical protein LTS07_011249 [Exophiala sideris]KAK5022854.1 hypothetical protein LTR13_011395 [Exophiala sideris]KAK5048797.1 hypothetical protein LTR69_011260 [Exophiala sideris]KAK5176266.1 hypothetical protein LTR44_011197 [Eurotiomycetes sp. CCFEE 6388]